MIGLQLERNGLEAPRRNPFGPGTAAIDTI
jgi:hypothetical protein